MTNRVLVWLLLPPSSGPQARAGTGTHLRTDTETGGAPGLRDRRCLAGSPADETGPPLLHHLPTHPPDHLQRPEADLHPQPDHGIDPGATDHARAAGIGSAVALGTGTETGPGAGQAVVAAGKSPLTGVPGVIPRTPGILGTIDPGMAGGRQMRDATERRTGAVANSPVLTEEMGRTDTQSMIKALLCPLTTSSVRVSTVRSKTWMGSGSNLRILACWNLAQATNPPGDPPHPYHLLQRPLPPVWPRLWHKQSLAGTPLRSPHTLSVRACQLLVQQLTQPRALAHRLLQGCQRRFSPQVPQLWQVPQLQSARLNNPPTHSLLSLPCHCPTQSLQLCL